MLFGSQPFTSALVMSNPKNFKYSFVWDKNRGNGHLVAKYRPLQRTEDICVFGIGKIIYNPQMVKRDKIRKNTKEGGKRSEIVGGFKNENYNFKESTHRHPTNYLFFPHSPTKTLHPTQKPIELMEYLIKTYTNEKVKCDFCGGSGEIESLTIDCDVQTCTKCKGEGVINSVILDNTFGSGTTCVAAKQLNRSFIGIEMDEKYFEIGVKRINETQPHVSLFSDCP